MAEQSGGTSLDAISTLLKLFQGTQTKETTSGGGGFTETSQTKLDQTALAGLLKQALESNQGLAAVSQGQRSAGLYNSSTNRLLSNDLLARLATNTAAAGAEKVSVRSGASPVTRTTVQGGMGGSQDMLSKLILAGSAYQKLGGTKALKDAGSMLGVGSSIPMTDMVSANMSEDPIGALAASQGWFGQNTFSGPALEVAGLGGDSFQTFAPENWEAFSFDSTPVAQAAEETGDAASNFLSAPSGNPSSASNPNTPTAGQVLEGAQSPSANTTAAPSVNVNAPSTLGSVYSLYQGIDMLTDDNSKNDAAGAVNTASGAYSAYKGYQAYDTASKAAQAANAASAAQGVEGTASAVDMMNFNWGSAGSGSALGYIGPVMSALNAERNPEGIHGKDYRHAVGSAVLNYFGWGWAAPIVHKVAQPVLDAAMDAGEESGGIAGAFVADPVGSLISGEYEAKDVVQATLDPGNIFGGNPGGSVGAVAAYGLDPIGAALGDKGVFSVAKDTINKVDSAISPGRVVCTELAFQGKISVEKYQRVLQPGITLTGRVLLGYHILGVPAVRKMRKDPEFVDRILPYVNAYLDHKLGKKNLTGFLIKNLGEPLCWLLSFFSRDPDYYQTLYPYRRVRNG